MPSCKYQKISNTPDFIVYEKQLNKIFFFDLTFTLGLNRCD